MTQVVLGYFIYSGIALRSYNPCFHASCILLKKDFVSLRRFQPIFERRQQLKLRKEVEYYLLYNHRNSAEMIPDWSLMRRNGWRRSVHTKVSS